MDYESSAKYFLSNVILPNIAKAHHVGNVFKVDMKNYGVAINFKN